MIELIDALWWWFVAGVHVVLFFTAFFLGIGALAVVFILVVLAFRTVIERLICKKEC